MNLIKGNGMVARAAERNLLTSPVHVRKLKPGLLSGWVRPAVREKLGPLPKIGGIFPGISEFVHRMPVSGFSGVHFAAFDRVHVRRHPPGGHLGFFTLVTFKPL